MRGVLATLALAFGFVLGASLLGLGVNALRRERLPLVAPFPYQQDCVDKTLRAAEVAATVLRVEEARALLGRAGVLFLDARPAEDFGGPRRIHSAREDGRQGRPEDLAQAPIPGARSFPYSFVTPPDAAQVAELRRYLQLVVYCDSPEDRLAKMLADQLRGLGLTGVCVLQGGLAAWRAGAGARAPNRERVR